jgi:hypothetical protein
MTKFLEVCVIHHENWSDNKAKQSDLRFINIDHIVRVHPSADSINFKDRAEIILSDGRRYNVFGSYETIISRINSFADVRVKLLDQEK